MNDTEEYFYGVFRDFLNGGSLPTRLPPEKMAQRSSSKEFDEAVHYLSHVITDKDIRDKDPELNEYMLDELRKTIEALGLERQC